MDYKYLKAKLCSTLCLIFGTISIALMFVAVSIMPIMTCLFFVCGVGYLIFAIYFETKAEEIKWSKK